MSEVLKEHHHLILRLEEAERLTLEEGMRHHPRAAVRERCAALLKIAQGLSPHAVARQGLLMVRDPDTVYQWLRTYEQEGIAGLLAHRHGGIFDQAQKQAMQDRLHAPPEALSPHEVAPARWTLQAVKERVSDLADYSLSGICQYLHRCGIVWRHGRVHYYSPDPKYLEKEAQVLACLR